MEALLDAHAILCVHAASHSLPSLADAAQTERGTMYNSTMHLIGIALMPIAEDDGNVPGGRARTTFATEDLDAVAVALRNGKAVRWTDDPPCKTPGAAGSAGYKLRQAVGAHLGLTPNDKGGFPQIRSQVVGIDKEGGKIEAYVQVSGKRTPNKAAVSFAAILTTTETLAVAGEDGTGEDKPK